MKKIYEQPALWVEHVESVSIIAASQLDSSDTKTDVTPTDEPYSGAFH